jgi:hypothetical protein
LVLDSGLRRLRRFGRELADTHCYLDCDSVTDPIAVADTNAHANAIAHANAGVYVYPQSIIDADSNARADGRMPEGRQVVGGGVERRR